MIDLSFLEEEDIDVKDKVEQISPMEKYATEIAQLRDIAKYIGSYTWEYTNGDEEVRPGLHDGPVAQELLQVPGLASAVTPREDGTLQVDTGMVTLAVLGYVSALSRLILGIGDGEF